ncbi:MAG: hypothetical protein WAO35_01000, partial [Terriglobia bacterium]
GGTFLRAELLHGAGTRRLYAATCSAGVPTRDFVFGRGWGHPRYRWWRGKPAATGHIRAWGLPAGSHGEVFR